VAEQTRKLTGTGIKSVKLGTRDEGFENESNDCMVKALQAVTGVPYRDAHAVCAERFRRRPGRGCRLEYLTLAPVFGYRFIPVDNKPVLSIAFGGYRRLRRLRARYQTLTQFVSTHRTGRWFVASNYHAFAVIDGVVYDNGAAGTRTQVAFIYEVISDSDYERRQGGN
jgi:hypothetical protein